MAFHFTNFQISGPSFRFRDFEAEIPEAGDPYPLDITVFTQPTDRYTKLKGISPSVAIFLSGPQLPTLPVDFSGFIVERSDDFGLTWSDISGLIQDAHFYVDTPPVAGLYMYRAVMQVTSGAQSSPGNEVPVTVGEWEDVDDLGVSEVEVSSGILTNRLSRYVSFPNGFDGEAHTAMSISEASVGGGYAGGWYMKSSEFEAPDVFNHIPVCGSLAVSLPLNIITFQIQDKPFPGGSGVDDNSVVIRLSVTSQYSGSSMIVRQGTLQPMAPTITCSVLPGVDPLLDRDVTITTPVGYIQTDDIVTVTTYVRDLDGNEVVHTCEFTMEHEDDVPPEVEEEEPVCGTGVDPDDDSRAPRDADFSFKVSDSDSGVDQSTLQVFYGASPLGPWTQVLQNGVTFLGGFTGSVTADGSGGFDVVISRPSTDPLWPAGSLVCFRVDVDDLASNSTSDVCCFRVEALAQLNRVVPIAEDILFVEFSLGMENGNVLRDPGSYSITPSLGSNGDPVTIKSVLSQQFQEQADPNAPEFRYGEGYPNFVYLNTTPNSDWEKYTLTVSADLKDRYGQFINSSERSAEYRGRRTKVDEGRQTVEGETSREDSLHRRILVGILHADAQIGDVYVDDDWEPN